MSPHYAYILNSSYSNSPVLVGTQANWGNQPTTRWLTWALNTRPSTECYSMFTWVASSFPHLTNYTEPTEEPTLVVFM
ncbi:hypothetical protein BofuT4_uP155370.1 [Botrytis cinerea T4]|uniref:Uncharacterized protein n=1 Tax=Botryotinia fuckeliana (strain T4) TaxID=999810 RepID=G2YV98_BOTF4|nr:hypothetical protein BofuT4_uP155370.1 [Botrytis cinerea T4]